MSNPPKNTAWNTPFSFGWEREGTDPRILLLYYPHPINSLPSGQNPFSPNATTDKDKIDEWFSNQGNFTPNQLLQYITPPNETATWRALIQYTQNNPGFALKKRPNPPKALLTNLGLDQNTFAIFQKDLKLEESNRWEVVSNPIHQWEQLKDTLTNIKLVLKQPNIFSTHTHLAFNIRNPQPIWANRLANYYEYINLLAALFKYADISTKNEDDQKKSTSQFLQIPVLGTLITQLANELQQPTIQLETFDPTDGSRTGPYKYAFIGFRHCYNDPQKVGFEFRTSFLDKNDDIGPFLSKIEEIMKTLNDPSLFNLPDQSSYLDPICNEQITLPNNDLTVLKNKITEKAKGVLNTQNTPAFNYNNQNNQTLTTAELKRLIKEAWLESTNKVIDKRKLLLKDYRINTPQRREELRREITDNTQEAIKQAIQKIQLSTNTQPNHERLKQKFQEECKKLNPQTRYYGCRRDPNRNAKDAWTTIRGILVTITLDYLQATSNDNAWLDLYISSKSQWQIANPASEAILQNLFSEITKYPEYRIAISQQDFTNKMVTLFSIPLYAWEKCPFIKIEDPQQLKRKRTAYINQLRTIDDRIQATTQQIQTIPAPPNLQQQIQIRDELKKLIWEAVTKPFLEWIHTNPIINQLQISKPKSLYELQYEHRAT